MTVATLPAPARKSRRPQWPVPTGLFLLSLIPAGVATVLSGMWMAVFYPHPVGDGALLLGLRLTFGLAMLASIALAVRAISRRNFVVHGEWMTRAYAIAVGKILG